MRVLGGDIVVRTVGVADGFDLDDLVVRFGGEKSSFVGEAEVAEVFVLDLVFLAGPVAGTAIV